MLSRDAARAEDEVAEGIPPEREGLVAAVHRGKTAFARDRRPPRGDAARLQLAEELAKGASVVALLHPAAEGAEGPIAVAAAKVELVVGMGLSGPSLAMAAARGAHEELLHAIDGAAALEGLGGGAIVANGRESLARRDVGSRLLEKSRRSADVLAIPLGRDALCPAARDERFAEGVGRAAPPTAFFGSPVEGIVESGQLRGAGVGALGAGEVQARRRVAPAGERVALRGKLKIARCLGGESRSIVRGK